MGFVKTPVKGMRDFLPKEMALREYLMNEIKKTYTSFGYNLIETPAVEHISNLTSNQGGENEKLLFKILKRGEKLENASLDDKQELADLGLRYDLTVPLTRFYANNANELESPFKALQIGNVWRAERPQKGRYRQFTQCDIDIFGESSNLAEVDLITATSTLLNKFDFIKYKVRINDRRILKAMAIYAGFREEDIDSVLISLDKIDKISKTGVYNELLEKGFDSSSISMYLDLFDKDATNGPLDFCGNLFNDYMDDDVLENLEDIILKVKDTAYCDIVFDPTLVRGMSYYTGPIFEIEAVDFNGSICGGGRYDEMVKKFINVDTPACGFSIGFERLVTIFLDHGFEIPNKEEKCVYILEKNMDLKKELALLKEANNLRAQGKILKVVYRNKNAKFQKEKLINEGYTNIFEYFCD